MFRKLYLFLSSGWVGLGPLERASLHLQLRNDALVSRLNIVG
jgi:hypothetical protein